MWLLLVWVGAAMGSRRGSFYPVADTGTDEQRREVIVSATWNDFMAMLQEPRFSDFQNVEQVQQGPDRIVADFSLYGFRRRMYFSLESMDKNQRCLAKFLTHYAAQRTRRVLYLENISDYILYTPESGHQYCIILGEAGEDASRPLFHDSDSNTKYQNSERIIKLVGRIVHGFATLTSLANFYHANINLQAITVVRQNLEIFPRITNLDKAVKMTGVFKRVQSMPYDSTHRPPEIDKRIIRTLFPNGDDPLTQIDHFFDLNFKEDAYALGITLMELIHLNDRFLDPKSKRLDKTKKIIRMMMVEDPEKRNSIRKTLKLLREFVSFVKDVTQPIMWLPSINTAFFGS